MSPPPLTSPPYPYTTLFRSFLLGRLFVPRNGGGGESGDAALHGLHHLRAFDEDALHACRALRLRHSARARLRVDRKSTRLNSSHLKISYAVFCLKKKMTSRS